MVLAAKNRLFKGDAKETALGRNSANMKPNLTRGMAFFSGDFKV